MKQRIILFFIFSVLACLSSFSQNKLNIYLKSGNNIQLFVSEIDSMTMASHENPDIDDDPEQQTSTGDATNVTNTTATLICYAKYILESLATDLKVGVIYSTDTVPSKSIGTQQTISKSNIDTEGMYKITVTGLQPNTTYYYRSFVYQSGLWFYGKIRKFTTTNSSGTMDFSNYISDITCFSAKVTARYELNTSQTTNPTAYGICYGTNTNPTEQVKASNKNASNTYNVILRALAGNTIYYYRPYAILDGITYYGNTSSFQTAEDNVVTTGEMSEDGSVRSKLNLTGGAFSTLQVGLCWSTMKAEPTINDKYSTVNEVDDDNCFVLTPNAYGNIYYRAFVKIDGVAHYGKINVSNRKYDSSTNTKEYVDLALPSGTLWATCNIGASSPEQYGDYFAWGETTPQGEQTFTWESYEWCNGSYDTQTKYSTDINYGCLDNKTELELSDDAAYVNWGSEWRMPNYEQIQELYNSKYTTTSWSALQEVSGLLITSNQNGNSIFLPASGYCVNSAVKNTGTYGSIWSRTLYAGSPSYAYDLYYNSGNTSSDNGSRRYYGRNIRSVYIK